jgi:hypothetical protein
MESVLEYLRLDLAAYRSSVDRIMAEHLADPRHFRECFLDILVSMSRLYLDYQLFRKQLPELWETAKKARKRVPRVVESDIRRQREHRARFREKLESLSCWKYFRPENAFSESTGLLSIANYIDVFSLHLPEIYEETLCVEVYVEQFLNTSRGSALAELEVGMQHLGRNHISFVLQALEWASDEMSWSEP